MANRLAGETSPYLLQHADNPVDWHPWGPEPFRLARETSKPILLSIGYSACHWCHVMAHESFEDAATAERMNALFINIKVDREERPDVDAVYQIAHQLMTQRNGGWPLTMFLTPDGVPFLGGTYFPRTQRYGLPSFNDLLQYVSEAYGKQQDDIAQQNASLLAAMASTVPVPVSAEAMSEAPIAASVTALDAQFDSRHGGFGAAPKFPHPTDLWLLLRQHARTGAPRARMMAQKSLGCMAAGGLFDQLGGGFFRYSVDAEWNIPHFEKMLSDNGALLRLYAEAYTLSAEPEYARVVADTAAWVMRELQSPNGGYYAALDADSEGVEGKYYIWSPAEIEAALSAEEYAVVARHYGLTRGANFESSHWHLYIAEPLWQVANNLKLDPDTCAAHLASARAKLFALRETRTRPGLDDKILTAWNALMIEGMARASAVFGQPAWLASARRALDFMRDVMWSDGRLHASAKGWLPRFNGYLDDYAFLLNALLELMQVDFRLADLDFACALADALLEHFEDREAGGFFYTSHDHEALIHRPKPGLDHALPGGNAAAALGLQRLGHITGDARYLEAAARTLSLYYPYLVNNPSGYSLMGVVLMESAVPPSVVVLRGPAGEVAQWRDKLNTRFAPDTLTLAVGTQPGLPAVLNKPVGEGVQAWVCSGPQCAPPVSDWATLEAALELK